MEWKLRGLEESDPLLQKSLPPNFQLPEFLLRHLEQSFELRVRKMLLMTKTEEERRNKKQTKNKNQNEEMKKLRRDQKRKGEDDDDDDQDDEDEDGKTTNFFVSPIDVVWNSIVLQCRIGVDFESLLPESQNPKSLGFHFGFLLRTQALQDCLPRLQELTNLLPFLLCSGFRSPRPTPADLLQTTHLCMYESRKILWERRQGKKNEE